MPSRSSAEAEASFTPDESVYAYHGPLLFKAEVLEKAERTSGVGAAATKVRLYKVHYSGWDEHWDEWVPESRLLKDTAQAEELQKQRVREFKRAHNKRKAQDGTAGGSAGDGGGAGSAAEAGAAEDASKKARGGVAPGDESIVAEVRESLRLPQGLKLKLVEDWERVTRERKLVPLPRSPTIDSIFNDFVAAKAKKSHHERLYTEVCDGLCSYFNQVNTNTNRTSTSVRLYTWSA